MSAKNSEGLGRVCPTEQCPGHWHPPRASRLIPSVLGHPKVFQEGAPVLQCPGAAALWGSGVPCGATGNVILTDPGSTAPTNLSFFQRLSQQVWDVLHSWPGPRWAVQRFLCWCPSRQGWREPQPGVGWGPLNPALSALLEPALQ